MAIIDATHKVVYLFDPLGSPFEIELRNEFQAAFRDMQVEDMQIHVQTDSYNCGIWAVWVIGQYLKYLEADTPEGFTLYLRRTLRSRDIDHTMQDQNVA